MGNVDLSRVALKHALTEKFAAVAVEILGCVFLVFARLEIALDITYQLYQKTGCGPSLSLK